MICKITIFFEKDPQNSLNFKNEKKIVKFEFSIYVSQSVTGAGPRVVTEWWTHLTAERRRGWRTLCHVTRAVCNLYNIQWKTRHRKARVIFAENESKRSRARHLDSFKRNFSLLLHVCRYVPKIGKLGLNLNCVAPMFIRLWKVNDTSAYDPVFLGRIRRCGLLLPTE